MDNLNNSLTSINSGLLLIITQQLGEVDISQFVNPYNVFSWTGEITLSPESDEWKETELRPDVIINDVSLYDQLVQQAEASGLLGTVWNEWTTNWTGTDADDTITLYTSDGTTWYEISRSAN